jgi:magnesium transporter
MAQAEKQQIQKQLELLNDALESGVLDSVARMLNSLEAQDVAHLLESSPPRLRHAIWRLVDLEHEGEVLQFLSEEIQTEFLQKMDAQEFVAATENLEYDDIADLLQLLPNTVIREVLDSMDQQDRQRLETVLTYDEDTAGGLMNTDTITVRPPITLDVVLRYLRRHPELPEMTDNLIVVNRRDEFIGLLPLTKLLTSDPGVTVREVMLTDVEAIPASMSARDVARLFERNDWVTAPVVDDGGKLLGRITIDDVVDVIREEGQHSMMSMAGLDEDEDTFAPVFKAAPRRAVWLCVNLLTAFAASAVIRLFEGTIEKVVALAVLMPIVASMGGVAGNQTVAIVIRGIALGHIGRNNVKWLINREIAVGAMNGLFLACITGLAAGLWFQDVNLALVIAAAIIVNLLTAGFMGATLPLLLRAIKIDPALAASMALTTFTDIVGFMAFLGFATLFLL